MENYSHEYYISYMMQAFHCTRQEAENLSNGKNRDGSDFEELPF